MTVENLNLSTAGEQLLRFLFARSSDVCWATDEAGRIQFISTQVQALTGREAGELIGLPLASLIQSEDAAEASSLQNAALAQRDTCTLTYRILRTAGKPVWVEATVYVVRSPDGALTGFAGTWRDVGERRRIEEAYEHQAYHDRLTNLPNRRLFEDRLTIALAQARRIGGHIAVLVIGVDRFTNIDETFGRPLGDELLAKIAERLSSSLRASDTFARIAGKQFALIAGNLRKEEDAVRIAEALLKRIRDPIAIPGQEFFVSASIGIAIFPKDGDEVPPLLASATTAMSQCRHSGGNGWYLHRAEIKERAIQRLAIEMDLHRAVGRREFVVRYQPIMDVATQRLAGVEALVRWQHPTRGELPPASFLDVAEDTGLVVSIGEQVINAACSQAHEWQAEGWTNPNIAVNLSARQFDDAELLARIDRALAEHQLPASTFQFEITEATAIRDVDRTLTTLVGLQSRGARVALDDFGVGYSSLAYLKRLPVDILKIDRAFLSEVPGGRDEPIVAAVIAMAHALGLGVIAEGVERQEQLRFLAEQQCDFCQGFLFGKPVTAQEISRMRAER